MARQNFFPFHAEEFCFFPGIASELTCLFTCRAGAGPGRGGGVDPRLCKGEDQNILTGGAKASPSEAASN